MLGAIIRQEGSPATTMKKRFWVQLVALGLGLVLIRLDVTETSFLQEVSVVGNGNVLQRRKYANGNNQRQQIPCQLILKSPPTATAT